DGIRDRTVTGVQTCALPISHEKESYDDVTERPKVVIQLTYKGPKSSFEMELFRHQAEQFYAAYGEGYNYRNESYGDVVIQLADRFHKSPAIGAKHQYGICRVDQRHPGCEKSGKDQNRPKRQPLRR